MRTERCAACSSYNPKCHHCSRHLCGIEDILSCTAAGDATTEIMRGDGEVFSKKDETTPQEQRTYIARDLSYTDFLKNLRKSVRYSEKAGDYEMGFYHGWITACNAALATLGIDPLEK